MNQSEIDKIVSSLSNFCSSPLDHSFAMALTKRWQAGTGLNPFPFDINPLSFVELLKAFVISPVVPNQHKQNLVELFTNAARVSNSPWTPAWGADVFEELLIVASTPCYVKLGDDETFNSIEGLEELVGPLNIKLMERFEQFHPAIRTFHASQAFTEILSIAIYYWIAKPAFDNKLLEEASDGAVQQRSWLSQKLRFGINAEHPFKSAKEFIRNLMKLSILPAHEIDFRILLHPELLKLSALDPKSFATEISELLDQRFILSSLPDGDTRYARNHRAICKTVGYTTETDAEVVWYNIMEAIVEHTRLARILKEEPSSYLYDLKSPPIVPEDILHLDDQTISEFAKS